MQTIRYKCSGCLLPCFLELGTDRELEPLAPDFCPYGANAEDPEDVCWVLEDRVDFPFKGKYWEVNGMWVAEVPVLGVKVNTPEIGALFSVLVTEIEKLAGQRRHPLTVRKVGVKGLEVIPAVEGDAALFLEWCRTRKQEVERR